MPEEFYRIKRLPPYVFAEVNSLKAQARAAGRDVIDLGMGNPDGPTPPHIVAKLVECVQNPKTHGYSSSRGIAGVWAAAALPMGLLAWIVAPWLRGQLGGRDPFIEALLICLTAGLLWVGLGSTMMLLLA